MFNANPRNKGLLVHKLKCIAHRGAMKIAPENTLTSFRNAIEIGADAIEFDLHMTLDGKLVVHHDFTFEKEIGSGVPIYQLNSNDVRQIDIGSWFSPSFSSERVPYFEEVLQEMVGKCQFEIELKSSTVEFAQKVIEIANSFSALQSIELTSPHSFILNYIKNHYPEVKCGAFIPVYPKWLANEIGEKILLDQMTVSGYEVAHLPLSILTPSLSKKLHSQGAIVHAANCDEIENVEYAIKCNADQLSTSDIEMARKIAN